MPLDKSECWDRLINEVVGWTMKPHAEVSANILLSYMLAIEDQQRLIDKLERTKTPARPCSGNIQGG